MDERSSRILLFIVSICAFFVGLDSLVVAPLVPVVSADVHSSPELGGLLVTSYALCYGISAPFLGPLSDRAGRKKLILLGIVVFGIGTALTSAGKTFAMLVLFRGVTGLGSAMIMPSVFALVGDTFRYEKRGKAMGVIMAAMVGSTILGVPAGSVFAQFGSWRITFLAISILIFLVFFIVLFRLPKSPPKEHNSSVFTMRSYFGQIYQAVRNPSIFFALLSTLLWTAGLQGMFAYVGVYYNQNFGMSVGEIGLIIFAAGSGSVIGNYAGGRLSDKYGKRKIIGVAAVLAAMGVLGFSLLTHLAWWAIADHVLWSTSIGLGSATLTALISELDPKVRGTVLSLNSSAMYIGMTLASSASAFLLGHGGFVLIGVMCSLASLSVLPICGLRVKENSMPVRQMKGEV